MGLGFEERHGERRRTESVNESEGERASVIYNKGDFN